MKKRHIFWGIACFVLMSAILSLTACVSLPPVSGKASTAPLLSVHEGVQPETSQILLVVDESFLFFTFTKIYLLEKSGTAWRQAMAPVDAVIGRNGFAAPGEKREGDGRTPSGLYRLGTAFGYAETLDSKMPYRQILADDVWVDDPSAPDYNRWIKQSQTAAASYEKLKRADDLYKYAIVIEYNTDPVVKNHGSAIFLHVWAGSRESTEGCVAVSEENILKILSWLNPKAKPFILINPGPG